MRKEIALVDHGRGLQLSTSRITVHDLVPYLQEGCSYDEVIRWIPSLSQEEIAVVESYYREHKEELDEYEVRVRAYDCSSTKGHGGQRAATDSIQSLFASRIFLSRSAASPFSGSSVRALSKCSCAIFLAPKWRYLSPVEMNLLTRSCPNERYIR